MTVKSLKLAAAGCVCELSGDHQFDSVSFNANISQGQFHEWKIHIFQKMMLGIYLCSCVARHKMNMPVCSCAHAFFSRLHNPLHQPFLSLSLSFQRQNASVFFHDFNHHRIVLSVKLSRMTLWETL